MVKYRNNLHYRRNYRPECLLSFLLSSEGSCQCDKVKISINSRKWKIMPSFTADTIHLKNSNRIIDELLD